MRFFHGFVASLALFAGTAQAENHLNADTVVATVGDTEITLGHMIVLKQRLPRDYQSLPGPIIWDGVLDQLVQQTLLGETIENLSPGSQAALENERRALAASEAITDIGESAVTDEAIEAAYSEYLASEGEAKEWNVDHILFQDQENEEPGTAREEAAQTIAELEAGGDFAALARERSDGPSGPAGGELGWFSSGDLVPEFEEAMVAMEPGTISSEPVESRYGWHIIRLNEVRDREAPTLEQLRPQLVENIRRAAIAAVISDLEAGTTVTRMSADEIDPSILDSIDLLE